MDAIPSERDRRRQPRKWFGEEKSGSLQRGRRRGGRRRGDVTGAFGMTSRSRVRTNAKYKLNSKNLEKFEELLSKIPEGQQIHSHFYPVNSFVFSLRLASAFSKKTSALRTLSIENSSTSFFLSFSFLLVNFLLEDQAN